MFYTLYAQCFDGEWTFPNTVVSSETIRYYLLDGASVSILRRSKQVIVAKDPKLTPGLSVFSD